MQQSTVQINPARVEQLTHKVESLEKLINGVVADLLPSIRSDILQVKEMLAKRRKEHLLVEEVAELTGRSAFTVRRWITSGKINAIRLRDGGPRGRLLIPRHEIDRLVASGKGGQVPDAFLDEDGDQ